MKDRSHIEVMGEYFRTNPTYAAKLLAEVRRNGDLAELNILLRHMVGEGAPECEILPSPAYDDFE